jgi:uncharacterized membrane protein YdbT with pleckstrin-like domain
MNEEPSALTLGKGEKVIWSGRRSWESLVGDFIALIIFIIIWFIGIAAMSFYPYGFGYAIAETCAFGGIIIILILILVIFLKRLMTEYVISNKRVHCKYGLIRRVATQAKYNKITDTALAQGFLGRILNYGNVVINTAGGTHFEIAFIGVQNPKSIIAKVNNVRGKFEDKQKEKDRVERIKDRYYTGEITKAQYEEAMKRIKEES